LSSIKSSKFGLDRLEQETREIVAYACGDRSENTCRVLGDRLPSAYKKAIVFRDYWEAYQAVIPGEQHFPVEKNKGNSSCRALE